MNTVPYHFCVCVCVCVCVTVCVCACVCVCVCVCVGYPYYITVSLTQERTLKDLYKQQSVILVSLPYPILSDPREYPVSPMNTAVVTLLSRPQ